MIISLRYNLFAQQYKLSTTISLNYVVNFTQYAIKYKTNYIIYCLHNTRVCVYTYKTQFMFLFRKKYSVFNVRRFIETPRK